ncbi:hypothetical protein KDN24_09140 [Bacillus sp. Bva_UNVM-123]|uniref:hypothetical protein n=1 Tax=Bacillus sp. Bva_UNVM-123 TaxID=2829798 RepID=UPI00391F92F6
MNQLRVKFLTHFSLDTKLNNMKQIIKVMFLEMNMFTEGMNAVEVLKTSHALQENTVFATI